MQNTLNIDQRRFFNAVVKCFEQVMGGYPLNEAFIAKEKNNHCIIFLIQWDGKYYKTHNLEPLCVPNHVINKLIAKYNMLKA
jgi:hypothetical protein